MGDKISQLPAATTVDGTELVPIVQGGATKQVTGAILRSPTGSAGGDLGGSYPNPTLAAITTAQSGVGSQSAIPVISVDQKGRVVALSTVANVALTTNQIAGLSTSPAAALATTGVAGLSTLAARADHQHERPTPAEIGALSATASAGGDLVGNYPNPTLAAVTTAQSNVGSGTQIPVLSVDAKGRITSLSSVPVSASTTAITSLTGDVVASGPGAASASLAAITTAQSNVGSGTQVPVLSIDAKGRVIGLSSTPISGSAGGTVTSITAGTGLSGGTITSSGTIAIASVTTAQSNVGSATQIPVISVNAQGQITSLSSVAATGGAPLTTNAPAALATTAIAGLSSEAARADHRHALPSASDVGALAATAAAGGDLEGNYPNPTLASITTAQSNVGSSSVIPVLSIDGKGRVTALSTAQFAALTTNQIAGLATNAAAALATTGIAGLSTFAAREDHQHPFPTPAQIGAISTTQIGAASGICPLGSDSKVASLYLPSYVDDIIEVANFASLPNPGETGKIYVTLDTNLTYRWSGSAYVQVSSGPTPASALPLANGTAAVGTSLLYARQDHVHPAGTQFYTVPAERTSAFTLALTDAQTICLVNSASAVNVTIPTNASVAFPVGSVVNVIERGIGNVNIRASSGVSVVYATPQSATSYQGQSNLLSKIGTDTWHIDGVVVNDPYYAFNSALLHFNGANGAQTFTDNSASPLTFAANNANPTLTTSDFKFGTASLNLPGITTGDYIACANGTPFAFGTGDFCIEFWANRANSGCYILGNASTSGVTTYTVGINASGNPLITAPGAAILTSSAAISAGTWAHVAFTREAGTFRVFINGVLSGSVTPVARDFSTANTFIVGNAGAANLLTQYQGKIDELRITKGAARYTTSFNVQLIEFPNF